MDEILGSEQPLAGEICHPAKPSDITQAWHHLWGVLIIHWSFLGPLPDAVSEFRTEFEDCLGRVMSADEWVELSARANACARGI